MEHLRLVGKQLKSHPALIPLFVFIGAGAGMCFTYVGRLAFRNPECSWDRNGNPEPWNNMKPDQQYKLFKVNQDYSKLKKERPDF